MSDETDLFERILVALKASPGCLGVETATTPGGKVVIFAWFASKDAVRNWYDGGFHRGLQRSFFPDLTPREPLRGVQEAAGPIMAIASLTFAQRSGFNETTLPVSQIAIELYQPITGGIFLGSRFAPDAVKVADMRDVRPA